MATSLVVGDIAIVHYNSGTDAFSFVFLRDVEVGTVVNFTDNGWLAAGGFRPGEGTVTRAAVRQRATPPRSPDARSIA